MAWITSAYMDNMITSTTRAALDGDDSTVFDQFEVQARVTVLMFITPQGYTAGTTTDNDTLKLLAAGQWFMLALSGRKGIDIPEGVKQAVAMLGAVFDGKMPIPGLDQNTADGVGGVKASLDSETSTQGRPPRWKRSDLRNW